MPKPPAIPPPYIDWPLDRWKVLLMIGLTVLLLWGAIHLRDNRQPSASTSPPPTVVIIPHINAIH